MGQVVKCVSKVVVVSTVASLSHVDVRIGLFQAFGGQLSFGICWGNYKNLEVKDEDNT